MSYFKNFGLVEYRYGDEDESTRVLVEDLTIYVDLLDQIDDLVGFYEYYYILDGDRPDTLSYKLYGTTDYYWTFYLMNQSLKETGWPLHQKELDVYVSKLFSGITFRPETVSLWNRLRQEGKRLPYRFPIATVDQSNNVTSARQDLVITTTITVDDPIDDNLIYVSEGAGIVTGFNISGLNIPDGTTITNIEFTGANPASRTGPATLTLSNNTTDDYEAVDGVSFPVTLTIWNGDAYKVPLNAHTADIRVGDIIRLDDVIQDETYVTAYSNNVVTLDKPMIAPLTTGAAIEIWGPMVSERDYQLGYATMHSTNRSGPELHAYMPIPYFTNSTYQIADTLNSTYLLENLQNDGITYGGVDAVIEPDAQHHYENSDGEWLDAVIADNVFKLNPTEFSVVPIEIDPPPGATIITNREYLQATNDEARRIRIIKPNIIARVVSEFERLVKG